MAAHAPAPAGDKQSHTPELVFVGVLFLLTFITTGSIQVIVSQLALTSLLVILAFWSGDYARRWWLRVGRTEHLKKEFYDVMSILEIKLPREIDKSPRAMELVLDAMHQGVGKNENFKYEAKIFKTPFASFEKWRKYYVDRYQRAEVMKWMSLEVESREGQLHFYIVTPKKYINLISSYIYSQYPGIEVTPADDYTNKFRPKMHGGTCDLYTSYYKLEQADYLPIKTYMDYELDADPKEQYKIDPITPLLESMASVGQGEHVWYQVLVRATYDEKWKKDGEDRIKALLTKKVKDANGNEKEERIESTKLTPKEKAEIEIIQKNIEKPGFDCHMRIVYLAENGYFKAENDQIVRNAMKSFSKPGFNTFKAENQNTPYPWMDDADKTYQNTKRSGWFFLYVMRSMFYNEVHGETTPFKTLVKKWKKLRWYAVKNYLKEDFKEYFKIPESGSAGLAAGKDANLYYLLNSEELATIYHFPGKVLGAPNFDRVGSQKSDAPNNLPI